MGRDLSSSRGRRIAVAVSGGGRSLANFLEREQAGTGYQVAAVIASRRDCGGAEIATRRGLPLFVGDFRAQSQAKTGAELYPWLAEHKVDWIVLAGFLKLFPVRPEWEGRIVNIHPALLPSFGGSGMYGDLVHRAVLDARAAESGATVHFVNERYDEGAVIAQITVPVRQGDTAETLAARVFAAECRLYPSVVNRLIAGSLPLAGGAIERMAHDPE